MTKPVVLQVGPYPDWDQIPLDAAFDMKRLFDAPDPQAVLAAHGPDVRGIATRGNLGADAAMINACPKLEIISVYGVGYDAVDVDLCRQKGIHVTNTPDVLTGDVADLGVAMMLCQSRGMIGAEAWVRNGSWAAKGTFGLTRRVFGRKAGILGLGRIGFEVGKRLSGFGMDIAYTDIAPKEYAPDWSFLPDAKALAACRFPLRDAGGLGPNAAHRGCSGDLGRRPRRNDHQHLARLQHRRRRADRSPWQRDIGVSGA